MFNPCSSVVRHSRRAVTTALTAMLVATPASAQSTAGSGSTIRLEDVVARIVDVHPKLQGQRFARAGADARIDQAGLRPAVEVGLDLENVFGTGGLRTFGDAEATLSIGTVLELGDKRAHRVTAAGRARDLLATEQDAERIDIVAEASRRFIRLLAEQERRGLAADTRELAARTEAAVKERVGLGRASPVDAANAALALAKAEISLAEQEATVRGAYGALAAMWGGSLDETATATGAFDTLAELLPFATLTATIDQNPDILRFAGERRVNEAKVRLAEAERAPDVTAAVGLRRLQATKDQALVLSVSVPLGAGQRSLPFAREAQSQLDRIESDEAAAHAELMATLHGLYQQAAAARETHRQLQAVALPEAIKAERLTDDGFRLGRFSLLELTTARRALLAVRDRSVTAAATFKSNRRQACRC